MFIRLQFIYCLVILSSHVIFASAQEKLRKKKPGHNVGKHWRAGVAGVLGQGFKFGESSPGSAWKKGKLAGKRHRVDKKKQNKKQKQQSGPRSDLGRGPLQQSSRLFGCEKTLSCPGQGAVCRHNIYEGRKHRSYICDCGDVKHCIAQLSCNDNPCKNGGRCNSNGVGEAFECECNEQYYGDTCEYVNDNATCIPASKSQNKIICPSLSSDCVDNRCVCKPGFVGATCNYTQTCFDSPCKNGAECIPNVKVVHRNGHMFKCDCPIGYEGWLCEKRTKCLDNPCAHNQTCEDKENPGKTGRAYLCHCSRYFSGVTCKKIIRCKKSTCENKGKCTQGKQHFECKCPFEYKGEICSEEKTCDDITCNNGGTCIKYVQELQMANGITRDSNVLKCRCRSHQFHGKTCSRRRICKENTCNKRGTCHQDKSQNKEMNATSYSDIKCRCNNGTIGDFCETRLGCVDMPCQNGATCRNTLHNPLYLYKCKCSRMFRGYNCEEMKHCDENPCSENSQCEMKKGQTNCLCVKGFKGRMCQDRIKCEDNPCKNNSTCKLTKTGSVKCKCKLDFTGFFCEDEIPLTCKNSQVCQNSGECLITESGIKCHCKPDYTGRRCQTRVKDIVRDPVPLAVSCMIKKCLNKGICVEDVELGFVCDCLEGFKGEFCEELNKDVSPLPDLPKIAENSTSQNKETKKKTECSDNLCMNNSTCSDSFEKGSYCTCLPGYNGGRCDQLVDCSKKPCLHDSMCTDARNPSGHIVAQCNCSMNTEGSYCQIVKCKHSNPCLNGATCEPTASGVLCTCSYGTNGTYCEHFTMSRVNRFLGRIGALTNEDNETLFIGSMIALACTCIFMLISCISYRKWSRAKYVYEEMENR